MIGELLFTSEKHLAIATQLKEEVLRKYKQKMVIAISGESGSGKSTISLTLARLLKKENLITKIIPLDNFYLTTPKERTAWRKKHGLQSVNIQEYDWERINKIIIQFTKGESASLPWIDLLTDQIDTLTTDFSAIDIIILDGLYAIADEFATLKILIDIPFHQNLKEQERRGKEIIDDFRIHVLQREHEEIKRIKIYADYFIDRQFNLYTAHQYENIAAKEVLE